jgi:transcriptional regulator with XRE-family HTH domain
LEDVAAAAEEMAAEQRQVARRARAMQRQRDRGWSWSQVLDRDDGPPLLEMLRRNGRHLAEVTRRLAHSVASGLSAEGASRRQIALRLDVSHQRVSAILNGQRRNHGASERPS